MSSDKGKTDAPSATETQKNPDPTPPPSKTGFKLIYYLVIPALILLSIALAILNFIPFYPNVQTELYRPSAAPELSGALQPNSDLNKARLLYDTLPGAESTAIVKDILYTGLSDGRIVQIQGDRIKTIVTCDNNGTEEEKCGRPLGIRADSKNLYVADGRKGLYKVDLSTKTVTFLHRAYTYIASEPSVLIDDVTVSKEGDIYFSVSSTKWTFDQLHFDFVELKPNGRILHYDPRTNTTRILIDKLYFPNGIQLEEGENSLLFAESSRYRVLRYYLRGPNKGGVEIVANNLPGIVDNIRTSGRGTYWVALVAPRYHGHWSILEVAAPYPWIRKMLLRTPYLLTFPIQIYDEMFQGNFATPFNDMLDYIIFKLVAGIGSYGLIVEIDNNGKIIRSLHSPDGQVHSISQATEYKGTLYLGSPWENGVWKLSLNDVTTPTTDSQQR